MKVRAFTLDLDDTLWPIWPVIERAEVELHGWLQRHAPRTAAMFDVPGLRQLRDAVTAEFPEQAHDFSWLRQRAIEQALAAAGDALELATPAFQHFFHWRQQVVLFDDAAAALSALSARGPVLALTNGNADLHAVGLDRFFVGILSARAFGRGKPHADFFHAGCALLGAPPAEVLHIGDDWRLDIEGAHHAGQPSAWVHRGHTAARPADTPIRPWFEGATLAALVSALEAAS